MRMKAFVKSHHQILLDADREFGLKSPFNSLYKIEQFHKAFFTAYKNHSHYSSTASDKEAR